MFVVVVVVVVVHQHCSAQLSMFNMEKRYRNKIIIIIIINSDDYSDDSSNNNRNDKDKADYFKNTCAGMPLLMIGMIEIKQTTLRILVQVCHY